MTKRFKNKKEKQWVGITRLLIKYDSASLKRFDNYFRSYNSMPAIKFMN